MKHFLKMTTTLLKLTAITLLCLSTALTGIAQSPQIKTSHAQNYFRTQTNAVMLVWVKTFTTSDGLQVVLNPDPNFTITRINAPAKWNCNIATKTCTRTNDGTPAILEFIQVIGTISANAPTTMTNSATLTGGGLASAISSSDPASVYNPSKIISWGATSQNRQDNLPTSYGFTSIGIGLRYGMGLQSDGSIVQWGATINGEQTDKPTDTGYLAIAAGSYHSVALASDGSIVQWGRNVSGQRNNKPTGTGFIALAATENGCVALTNEGKIVTWGTLDITDLPTDAGYIAIAAGYNHGIALRTTGSIAQWGANNLGQRTNLPPGGGFKAICSTNYSCYAQRQDGTLLGWGSSNNNPFAGMPTNSVAYFISNLNAAGAAAAMYDNGSVVVWGDVFTTVSPAPSTTGFALNSLALGGHGAALLPISNPTADGGNAQSTLVNTAFAVPLKVKLLDNAGNPIPNINFTFTAPSSGASGTFSNGTATITVSTDANGVASTNFTANAEAGPYTVSASYPGLNAVSFSLTNTLSSPTGTSNTTICANTATALSAGCAIGNVVWYDATGTNVQFTGSPFTTPTLTSNTLYKVACNNGVLQSGFTDVTVTVSPVRLYVNALATGANTGLTWTDAFTDLQSALNYSSATCLTEIWVAVGTYKPSADPSGNTSPADARAKTFVMKNGVAIYGGFSGMGTETELSQRNWRSNPTILSGDIGTQGVVTDNTYRVINNNFSSGSPLSNTAILDGFIVEKGYANGGFPMTLGGGMWNAYASPTIRNCVFRNNYAAAGAGMFNADAQPTITNCLFLNNTATVAGAGISNGDGTGLTKVINCTFYGNTGSNTINNQANVSITNCIIWGNGGGISGGAVTYSNVQGGFSGTGNLNTAPSFVNAAGGDFHLQQCSPVIDAGTATNVPTTDFEGNNRVDAIAGSGVVDMGAYEYQATYDVCSACLQLTGSIVYVNASASGGSNNGSSWANAFTDLQSALTLARTYPSCVTQIWVAKGTYKPHASDPNVSFGMVNGVTIYGGFPNDGTGTMANRNWNTNPTILSGDLNGDDTFTGTGTNLVISNVSDNSYTIIRNGNTTDNTARLDGFIVSGANNNSISGSGGGVYNDGNNGICNPVFMNCVFRHNLSRLGGAVANEGNNGICNSTFTHCLFYQNQAINNSTFSLGGAMYCQGNVTTVLSQCTFSQNKSSGRGGAIRASVNFGSPNVTLRNCILWDNTAATNGNQLSLSGSTLSLNLDRTLLQGGMGAIDNSNGTINNNGGLLDANPLFIDAGNGNFRLQQCSPAIDAGTSTDAPTTDLDGNNRVDAIAGSGVVDMGAYEYQATYDVCAVCANTTGGIVYVNASVSGGSNNGSSWTNAFRDLQSAFTLAQTYPSCVTQIWVAKGTYKPTSGSDRGISFSMVNGVAIYGGFPNDGTGTMANRNWNANPTILSGNIGAEDNSGDNSYRVISNINNGLTMANSLLDGFTIRDGNANNSPNNLYGGGMYNEAASPGLNNLIFMENQALFGAGMYNQASSPVLNNVVFSSNRSVGDGGGMYNFQSSPVLNSVIFLGNQAYSGGGININLSSPILNNVTFLGNQASRGGGMFLANSSIPILTNVTFSGNQATDGGALCNYDSNPVLKNCILWGNGSEVADFRVTNPTYTYCLIQGMNPTGTSNLDGTLSTNNPLFVSQPPIGLGTAGDLRLQACSPAINVGNDADNTTTADLAGNLRKVGIIDLGAYEYQSTPPAAITPTVTPTHPATCGGNNGSISLSGFLNTTTYSVTYKKNTNAVAASNFTSDGNGVITLTHLGAGTYTDIVAAYGVCVSNAATATLNDPVKPSLTLNTIPAICTGAMSFTIPYTNLTQSPNRYSISGTGIVGITDGELSNPINVTLSMGASGSSIPFTLTVKNTATNCVSDAIMGSVTVNALPTAVISGGGTVCAGETLPNVSIALTGTAPWSLTYSNGSTPTTVNHIMSSPYVITGAAAGNYSVTALSDAHCSGTSMTGAAGVIVNALPTAVISGGGTVCTGATLPNVSIALTGTAPWSVTYTNGSTPTTVTNIMSSPYVITAAAAGNYSVTALSDARCTGTSLTGAAGVIVNALPTAVISGGGTVCAGVTLPNVSIALTGTAPWSLTYTNGSTPTTVNNISSSPYVITAAAAGNYSVTALSDARCTGTSMTGAAGVIVNALPTAVISGGGTVCTGATLPNVSIALTGTAPWSITYTNGSTPTTVTNIMSSPYVITAAAAGNYSVTALSDAHCAGTSMTGTASVTVNALPTAVISGGGTVCTGATLPNVSIALTGTAPWSVTYTNGSTPTTVTNIMSSPYVITAAAPGNYSVTALSDARCTGTSMTGTATVTANTPPSLGTTPATLCAGQTLTLSPTSGGNWSSSNPTIASVNNQGLVSALSPGSVNFTFTQTGTGCSATTNNITIKPTPSSNLTASQTDVCPNTEVTLNPNCSLPTATVHWNPGAPTVTPNAATLPYIYKASCTADGCTGNETSVEVHTHRILVDMKDLDVGTLPLTIVRAVKDNMAPVNLIEAPVFPRRWTFIATGCDVSESAVFKLLGPVNFSTIDNTPPYAMFSNEGSSFYSLDHPNYGNGGSFPNGTYTLTVDLRSQDGVGGPFPKNRVATGSLLASRTLEFTVTGPPSIVGSRQGVVGSESFIPGRSGFAEISPNPVAHTLRLKVMEAKGQSVHVSLVDASGRTMWQRSFVSETHQHPEEFEVSHLNNGMYFLKVNTNDKQTTLKVVKVE